MSLAGNRYETDPALVGRKVELIFDPFDLTDIEIRYRGESFGTAAAHDIGTHVHPNATSSLADHDDMPAAARTDYLALVAAEHHAATRRSINFAALTPADAAPAASPPDTPPPWLEPPLPFPGRHDGDDNDGSAQAAAR